MPVTINGTSGVVTPGATVGSITGILKASSGVVSQAVAGTDYLVGGGSAIPSINTAKAWVNFNGTTSPGTIRSSYNVSSVTKTGTGNYILNFSTAFSNTSYAVVMGSSFNSSTGIGWLAFQDDRLGAKTVSQYYLATTDGAGYRDSPEISIAVLSN